MADTIPTELIEHIFEYAAELDSHTASQICLTNKLGRGIATPILYRTVHIFKHDTTPYGFESDDQELRVPRIAKLCRTFSENIGLALHVRHIVRHFDSNSIPMECIGVEMFQRMREQMLNFQPLVRVSVQFALAEHRNGTEVEDTFNTFLLLACSNLMSLSIRGPETVQGFGHGFLGDFLVNHHNMTLHKRWNPQNDDEILHRDGLQSLRELRLNASGRSGLSPAMLRLLIRNAPLHLPGLRKITIDLLMPQKDGMRYRLPVADSPIEELDIKSCGVGSSFIHHLLRECQNLKFLNITFNKNVDVYGDFDWGKFILDLKFLTKLETLHLDYLYLGLTPNEVNRAGVKRQVRPRPMVDLCCFSHLRTLSVAKVALFGCSTDEDSLHLDIIDEIRDLAGLLPESLQVLEIFCEGGDFSREDLDLLQSPETERLVSVTIWNCFLERWRDRAGREGSVAREEEEEMAEPLLMRRGHFSKDSYIGPE